MTTTATAETCAICHRPHRGSFACGSCIGRLQADLRAIPDLLDELETTRCRLDNLGSDPGRSAETRMVWSETASEAGYVLRNTITTWARDLWHLNGTGPFVVPGDTASLSRFLLRYPTWLAQHPAIDELADEIASAVKLARRAIDRPADTRVFLGRCNLDDPTNGDCVEELHAYRSQTEVECSNCGAIWQVSERREWLLAMAEDETATAETLAGLLTRLGVEVTVKDIQDAARKGLLTNVGIDSHTKRRRYRVGAVLDALLPARKVAA